MPRDALKDLFDHHTHTPANPAMGGGKRTIYCNNPDACSDYEKESFGFKAKSHQHCPHTPASVR